MLRLHEIHTHLTRMFGEGIGPLPSTTPTTEPAIQVDPLLLHFIGHELQENPKLACSELRRVVGTPHADGCTLLYHFASPVHGHQVTLQVEVSAEHPVVLTLSDLFPTAKWQEDEIENSCGVLFQTHPECTNENCGMHGKGTRCVRLTGAPEPFEP